MKKQQISKMHKKVKELKEIDKMKTQFLSMTSHELRTPITPMEAQVEMLLDGYFGDLNKKQRNSLKMILRNIERLDLLISDIMDVTRIEGHRLKISKEKAHIEDVIKHSVNSLKVSAKKRGINLKIVIPKKIPPFEFDIDRITQVLWNLIDNAIKFTDKGSVIVEATKKRKQVVISVRDSGIGIRKSDIRKLFRPFYQIEPLYTRKHSGTGLGLVICMGIIESHGGKMWVESEVKRGSTFLFTLPLE